MAEKKMFGAAPEGAPEQVKFGRGYMWGDGAAGAFDQDQGYVWGGNNYAADEDVARYQSLGQAALARQGATADYTMANVAGMDINKLYDGDVDGARREQKLAGNLFQGAMNGGAPSAASIQANQAHGANLQALLSAGASGRTGLQNASTNMAALGQYGGASAANVGALGAARAGEIAQANAGYSGSLGARRAADYSLGNAMTQYGQTQGQMATYNGQVQQDQMRLNQQYQQQMEQLAQGVRANELAAAQQTEARKLGLENFKTAQQSDENSRILNMAGASAQAGGSALASYAKSTSDERAKQPAWDVLPLYNPEGLQLRQSEGGRGFYDVEAPPQETIGGGMARPSLASTMTEQAPTKPVQQAPQKRRALTPDELMAMANAMEKEQKETSERSLAQGPAVREPDGGVLADANRKMAGEPYRYRPEFTPPDEVPGQVHHGFMAQNLEQNPVTATAVETGPNGVKQVHGQRMLQAVASGLADLQRQMDETRLMARK